MVNVGQIRKQAKKTGELCELVPFAEFLEGRVFVTKSGALGIVLRVAGCNYECLDHSQLDQYARRFEDGVRVFGEDFRIYQYVIKRKAGTMYSIDIYFVVLYEGQTPKKKWLDVFGASAAEDRYVENMEQGRAALLTQVEAFAIHVADFMPVERLDRPAAFAFFRRLLNYGWKADDATIPNPYRLDYSTADEVLEVNRHHLRLDDAFVKVLTLKEMPDQTYASMLRALLALPAACILVNEWKEQSTGRTRQAINARRKHKHNSKRSVTSYVVSGSGNDPESVLYNPADGDDVKELGDGLRKMRSGKYFGFFTQTVILVGETLAAIQGAAAEAVKAFSNHGARLSEERYNALNAWLAVLPGNQHYNLRYLYISNENYADLSFLWNVGRGNERNEHLNAECLAIVQTSLNTPYHLNLHHEDSGHTLYFGAPRSGKSFNINFQIEQMQKYDPLIFILDIGGSYEMLTRKFGGTYFQVRMDSSGFRINPFALPNTSANRQFLFSFVQVLIASDGYRISSRDVIDLAARIDELQECPAGARRLASLARMLRKEPREQLYKWVAGGQFGSLFDNADDTLELSSFQTFEFAGMDEYPSLIEPLLFYVLHRITNAVENPAILAKLKVGVIDEAWKFFRHATTRDYIIAAVKTWPKHNGSMIIATQSSADLSRDSDLANVLIETCHTKCFLANPGMDRAIYRGLFGLNETETDRIARLIPKREILMKRPDGAHVLTLAVDAKRRWLYATDPMSVARRREVMETHGFESGLDLLAEEG